jgi:flagellar motility protein MotE (MotC chaperone)
MRPSKVTLRFLPALVLVLLAALPAYVGSLWTGVASLALASDAPAAKPDGTTAAPSAGQNATAGTTTSTPTAQTPSAAAPATATPSAADAPTAQATADGAAANTDAGGNAATESTFDPLTLTKAEIDVLRQLAKRRDELDARAKTLDDREALLKATEQKIAEEVKQMQQMKAEYEQAKTARDDAAEANMRRLVTVYESMKPEEAARIFETMEGAVLLDVVTRMGERRLAPILAQMSPAKAQALTIAMANRRTLLPPPPPQG